MGMQGCGTLWHHHRKHSSVMPVIQLSALSWSGTVNAVVVGVIALCYVLHSAQFIQ